MRPDRRRRRLVAALAIPASLLAAATSVHAGEEPGDDHSVAPAAETEHRQVPGPREAAGKATPHTEGADEAPDCTFRRGSAKSEFASCLAVDASLDHAPRKGETVTLRVTVDSQIDLAAATVVVDVPDGFTLVSGPGHTQPETLAPSGAGTIAPQATATTLDEGQSTVLEYQLRADTAAEASIEVRVDGAVNKHHSEGALDIVNVTVGNAARPGTLSITSDTTGGVDAVASAPANSAGEVDGHVDAPLPEQEAVNDDATGGDAPQAAATSCISGTWGYQHPTAGYTGVPNYQVEVWDDDSGSDDDLLVEGVTAGNGTYNLCYNAVDGEGSGAQEVYVRYISANSVWRVRNTAASNSDYVNTTGAVSVADGANHSFGALQPANDVHRGIHAFHALNKVWNWGLGSNICFDHHDGSCRQMVLNWTNTSVDGTYYSGGGNDIHLAAADPDSEHLVIHEATHAIMDDVYNDSYPPSPNCNPHSIQGDSSQGCAWSEGFAEYVPAAVLDDPRFVWADGASLDLENRDWNTVGWGDGDDVEGRVAGAMIDIDDSAVAARDYWDFWAEVDTAQYNTFQDYASLGNGIRPANYAEFWTDRILDGLNVADDGAGGANYNNTIDYSFRDSLIANGPRTRPTNPEDPHRYRQRNDAATNPNSWTVVGIRPVSGDYDLRYYEDFAQTSLLASSAFGGTVMDFVAVDHNHRITSWDYPRVHLFSGSGDYGIEWATSTSTLGDGTFGFAMSSSDVLLVRDSAQAAGVTTYYRIVPSGGQNADMALMDSDPASSGTWVQPRPSAVRVGSSGGAGVEEAFSFSSGAADELGFVLLNASGSGTVTLYRDTTAPTGNLAIDGGAADTRTTAVDLDISAADAQTGIRDMRISVDGVFDAEPWQPFDPSASTTLPGGDGTKTVWVQLRNQANMVATVSDQIVLYTGVRCAGLMPTHVGTAAANNIIGTNGPDVIIGLGGADTLNGRGGNDVICGSPGNDTILGRTGVDRLYGMEGRDDLSGGPGAPDLCHGGLAVDSNLGGCEVVVSIP